VIGPRLTVRRAGEPENRRWRLLFAPRIVTLTVFRQRAGPCREAGGARGLVVPVSRPCARRTTQYGERKSLLSGPGIVRSGRAGPSGANGVGRHRRRLSIPSWGVSIKNACTVGANI
jgi:hypothetical protein